MIQICVACIGIVVFIMCGGSGGGGGGRRGKIGNSPANNRDSALMCTSLYVK